MGIGEGGEVFGVGGSGAEEEGAGDDVVDVAGVVAEGAVERETAELAFFVTDEGDGLFKGEEGLDVAVHNLLHGLQGGVDFFDNGFFHRFNDENFHNKFLSN